MDKFENASEKSGRSAMVLGPLAYVENVDHALELPVIGDSGLASPARNSRKRVADVGASAEFCRGFVFIGIGAISKVRAALENTGAIVSDAAPVFLDAGQDADVLFCVVSDRAFDKAFKTLRDACLRASVSGVVFFGDAELPRETSLRSLSRLTRIAGMVIGSQPVQFGHQSESAKDKWMEIHDLSRVRLGQDCPDVGAGFPETIRLRIQSIRLN